MKRAINAMILGTLGLIFAFDTVVYLLGNDTISEQITSWINNGNHHVFWGIVIVIVTHFWWGKYKD